MQPYLFPYFGYFQLLGAVDEFVSYNDVGYIKQGWINRNRLLVDGKILFFSVPIRKQSSNVLIADTFIDQSKYAQWKGKFYKTVRQNYGCYLYFEPVFCMLKSVLDSKYESISSLSIASINATKKLLGIRCGMSISDQDYSKIQSKGIKRIFDICRMAKADCYMNLPGGKALYTECAFKQVGIVLQIIKPRLLLLTDDMNLSILHLLFKYGPEQVKNWINECNVNE